MKTMSTANLYFVKGDIQASLLPGLPVYWLPGLPKDTQHQGKLMAVRLADNNWENRLHDIKVVSVFRL